MGTPRFNFKKCLYEIRPGSPLTPTNKLVVKTLWETGDVKATAAKLGRAVKTIEYHLHAIRCRIGNPTMTLIDLVKWGLRTGLLSCLALTLQAAPNRTVVLSVIASPSDGGFCNGGGEYRLKSTVTISASPYSGFVFNKWGDGVLTPIRQITLRNNNTSYYAYFVKTSPPPPVVNYQTNAFAYWPKVPRAELYKIAWAPLPNGVVTTALTFSTNFTITGLSNTSNYVAYVYSLTNGLTSVPSCSVSFVAGSGINNSCITQ